MTISNIYKNSWNFMKKNFGPIVLITLILSISISLAQALLQKSGSAGWILYIAVMIAGMPLLRALAGLEIYYSYRRDDRVNISRMFSYFDQEFWFFTIKMTLEIFAWSLLFIIPGIYKSLAYSRAIYIRKNSPQLSDRDCLIKSQEEMYGYKGKLFGAGLIIGLIITAIIGIPLYYSLSVVIQANTFNPFIIFVQLGLYSIIVLVVTFLASIFTNTLGPAFQAMRDSEPIKIKR